MLFNSYEFLLAFLPITFIGFFVLGRYAPKSYGTLWLVGASFLFYGYWDYHYVPLLFASISFNYLVGKRIENITRWPMSPTSTDGGDLVPLTGWSIYLHPRRKPDEGKCRSIFHEYLGLIRDKGWLVFGIVINVILLGYFKYTDFFLSTVNSVAGADYFDLPHIVLPLGISFFTFTQTAYLVDAYRGEAVNKSFLTYCEFVTIFPHLIAGPIINHKEMIPQFLADKTFRIDYENLARGIAIFAMGLFKKVAIADKLAEWANAIFSHTESLTFLEAWIGALSYTFQLYFDFSGYSEMAIGLGLMFNLRLPVNFNSPYQATSIIDFWRRWHMTLGGWVRDYLYIPLGGNRHGELAKMRNLMVSMMIIGLWHGAGWTFVFWGTMHGVALMINHQWRRLKIQFPKLVNIGLTFLTVLVLWVFFRAENFTQGWNVVVAMTDIYNTGIPADGAYQKYLGVLGNYGMGFSQWWLPGQPHKVMLTLAGLAVALLWAPNPIKLMERFRPNNLWAAIVIVLLVYSILHLNNYSEFLYFQF